MTQRIGSRIFSQTIASTTLDQELLDPTTLQTNYKFDITSAPVINMEVYNNLDTAVELMINNDEHSIVTLDQWYKVFDSGEKLMCYSVKVKTEGANVTFVAVLP